MAEPDPLADCIDVAYADHSRQFWGDGPIPPTLGEFIAARLRERGLVAESGAGQASPDSALFDGFLTDEQAEAARRALWPESDLTIQG